MNGGADLERRMIVNIGEQRFDKMIEEHKFYIDKTGFIKEWWGVRLDSDAHHTPAPFWQNT